MKITIITATYNSELTILDTLTSINQQTYRDIEHIIVDGTSTDNTLALIKNNMGNVSLESYQKKIKTLTMRSIKVFH